MSRKEKYFWKRKIDKKVLNSITSWVECREQGVGVPSCIFYRRAPSACISHICTYPPDSRPPSWSTQTTHCQRYLEKKSINQSGTGPPIWCNQTRRCQRCLQSINQSINQSIINSSWRNPTRCCQHYLESIYQSSIYESINQWNYVYSPF